MASDKTSHKRPTNQEILAMLASVYRDRSLRRDIFGRRAALPSEVARVLAQYKAEQVYSPCTTGESGATSAGGRVKAGKG